MIYLDSDFRCCAENDGSRREIEAPAFFADKCPAFIRGYRYVPEGESWLREDGTLFWGEMISPCTDSRELIKTQLEYELEQLRAQVAQLSAEVDAT